MEEQCVQRHRVKGAMRQEASSLPVRLGTNDKESDCSG